MSLVLADRVRQTSTTTGSGTFTLDGSVVGFQSFNVLGEGNTTYYTITLDSQWEVGIGTYSASTLTRDTVISSSTGSKIVFGAGTKDVFVCYPAEKSVNQDANNRVLIPYTSGVTDVGSLNVGDATLHTDSGVIAGFTASEQFYLYTSLQNTSGSNTSYASYAVNDGGHTAYAELGINNANYSYAAAGFPNNGFSTPLASFVESYGGPLVIGSWDSQKISFIVNGAVNTADAMTIQTTGAVTILNAEVTGGTINNTTIGAITPAAGTFTDVSVTTALGESAFNENNTITGWIYSGNSFSVNTQETAPNGLFIGSNGTKMYVNGQTGDDVNEFTLSTAWNITTATFVTTFSTAAQDTGPQDIFFKPDGLSMFVIGSTNDTVFQYTLSTAWDVSTASYASKSFSVTTQEASPLGLWFKPDGLVMYVVGSSSDTVFQYTLSVAWDVSTASYASIFYSVSAQDTGPTQVNLSADGLKMWVLGSIGDDIWEYSLGTAWNVSTATPVNNFYVGFQETSPAGMFIDSTATNRVYVVGGSSDTVYQYYTTVNSLKLDTQKLYIDGALSANGNFVAGQNAYVDGFLNIQGAITAGSITVGATSVSTLSSSGTTSLATSTAAQTVALGAGATTSGSLKTINIGTAGVSGSTTAINFGSAVSGATTTVGAYGAWTFNGVIFPQQATTAAAPAYVKGGMYFDTTLNKLRIGGATAWETVTSV